MFLNPYMGLWKSLGDLPRPIRGFFKGLCKGLWKVHLRKKCLEKGLWGVLVRRNSLLKTLWDVDTAKKSSWVWTSHKVFNKLFLRTRTSHKIFPKLFLRIWNFSSILSMYMELLINSFLILSKGIRASLNLPLKSIYPI